ncbi:MAG: hypothetical protein FP814_15740 [Desulfobacterium sp.]|nr:hypothetical protein [Desulfobacterium sp.]MBU3950039.1 hypothetical protein [Pseudomonadota bacterium]MBU4037399.1 hypothetical protein [Pseudomonadota bacterium]
MIDIRLNKSYTLFFIILLFCFIKPSVSWSFNFSEYEKQDSSEPVSEEISVNLKEELKCIRNKKIAVMVGEEYIDGGRQIKSSSNSPLVEELNGRLNQLGLKTYTPGEINSQIAKAEQEAFLANDIDAAASAASRLSAKYFLRGLISTRTQKNPVIGIDEVFLTLSLTLVDGKGRNLASGQLSDAVFSDSDTTATAIKLVRTKSAGIISDLFKGICKK